MEKPDLNKAKHEAMAYGEGVWAIKRAVFYILKNPSVWPQVVFPLVVTALLFALGLILLIWVGNEFFNSFDLAPLMKNWNVWGWVTATLDALGAHMERYCDLDLLLEIAQAG